MKAIVFDKVGPPLDVLELRDLPLPAIADNEVLVKIVSASINPGDFLYIQGLYPEEKRPRFPQQIAGNPGAGILASAGKDVSLAPGTLVTFYHDSTWAEYAAIPAERVIPLPAGYPLEKASQFQNAITAWDLLEESKMQAGQWLVLTAGNSSVSTQVLQFAKQRGVNVICIVREVQKHLDLKALGASEVIELNRAGANAGDRIGEITGNHGANAVIDCVGGPLLPELIRSLVPWGGQVVLYGGYSSERFELHNFDILMKGVTIKPYVYRYFFSFPQKEDFAELDRIAEAFGRPDFKVAIGGVHALEDFKTAIYESIHHPENGKRFFEMHS